MNEWLNEIAFVTSEMSDPTEPQTFQQVWWHPDLTARAKWREGIKLEFRKNDLHACMEKSGINKHSKRKEVSWMPWGIQNKM